MNSDTHHNYPEQGEAPVGQFQIRQAIRFGFVLILVLTTLIGVFGLYQLNKFKERIIDIVEVSNQKISLTIRMRDAVLMRVLSAQKMLATKDYFKRDDELQKFYSYAKEYAVARNNLLQLKMADDEKKLHRTISRLVQFSQPLSRKATEMLLDNVLPDNANEVLDSVGAAQEEVLALLNQFIRLQEQYSKQLVIEAKHEFQSTILMVVGLVVVLLLLGSVMARKITNLVSNKNVELFAKNAELGAAWLQAAKATHEKSKFLASMSHELRTPLTSIIGYAETLLDSNQQPKDLRHSAESIKHSGNHLYQIINDVLDISKIEAGRMELEQVDTSVCEVVNDVCSMVEEKVNKKGLLLVNNYRFPLPKSIMVDPTRLRQILLNLLGNAIKFTKQGTVTVNTHYIIDKHLLTFDVIDTGIGMAPESLDKVFEPFSQAEKSTTRNFGGSGLGLSISKQLAEKMGGDILCHSEEGKGSTFSIILPVNSAIELELIHEVVLDEEIPSDRVALGAGQATYNGNVLLAEDTPENQELISMLLRKSGARVDIVENGRQAVDAALSHQYDLILMDMQMPLLDGVEATKALRQQGYTNPIVALTANALRQDEEACEEAGANAFLVKPIDFPKFYQVLSRYLKTVLPAPLLAPPHEEPVSQPTNVLRPASQLTSESRSLLTDDDDVQPDDFLYDQELQEILNTFRAKLPTMVASIQQSALQKDWQQLQDISHKLKGLGGSFGYDNLTKISAEINNCARERVEDKLTLYIEDLKREYATILNKDDDRQVG